MKNVIKRFINCLFNVISPEIVMKLNAQTCKYLKIYSSQISCTMKVFSNLPTHLKVVTILSHINWLMFKDLWLHWMPVYKFWNKTVEYCYIQWIMEISWWLSCNFCVVWWIYINNVFDCEWLKKNYQTLFLLTSRYKVIESNKSNRWQCNSNRFENLKCNSNRWHCYSNRQHVIDLIPG